jgi:hypothetical protein
MAQIGFRSTTVADESAILAVLQEAHGMSSASPMLDSRHVHWKYWEPHEGWRGSRSYVLTKDERIVAHAAVVPATCVWGTNRIDILHVIDWAARPDARGAGAAIMQHLGKLADAIFTSNGSTMALQLLPFMGFKASTTTVTDYVRPVRPWLYLREIGAHGGWRLAARRFRRALWAVGAPSRPHGTRRAREISADELASAGIPWPMPKYGSAVLQRPESVMSYWLRCPAVPMKLFAVEAGSNVEGYFVLAFAPGQARIVDCWLDSDAPSGWDALVSLAVEQARKHEEVAEVAATSSEPLLSHALERCGFHALVSRPLFVRATGAVQLPDVAVRVQMLDDDSAYLHSGARDF